MMDIYICDIDGTLADKGDRNPYDESKVFNDTPLPTCEVIKDIISVSISNPPVIFLSGRTEKCRKDTTSWLINHLWLEQDPVLYMRKEGDNRPDEVIKAELYKEHIEGKYKVIGVFDDRLKVCRMWWSMGLFVFCCNQGLIEF